jgi:hypothetical protein
VNTHLGSRLDLQAALAAMPTPTLGKVPTRVLVTTAALACLVSVRLVLLGLVTLAIPALVATPPALTLVTLARAVLPPPGLVVTLAQVDTTRGLTRAVATLALLLVTPALVVTQVVALIRAAATDLWALQTYIFTNPALFPCAHCLLATSTRVRLRQLKLMRAPCLVLLPPC